MADTAIRPDDRHIHALFHVPFEITATAQVPFGGTTNIKFDPQYLELLTSSIQGSTIVWKFNSKRTGNTSISVREFGGITPYIKETSYEVNIFVLQARPSYIVIASKDDLTKIEGVGPKIQDILHQAAIHTFSDLATAQLSHLDELLNKAGKRYNLHDPSTWPQQAQLAADGKWDDLKVLQDQLIGGKV